MIENEGYFWSWLILIKNMFHWGYHPIDGKWRKATFEINIFYLNFNVIDHSSSKFGYITSTHHMFISVVDCEQC